MSTFMWPLYVGGTRSLEESDAVYLTTTSSQGSLGNLTCGFTLLFMITLTVALVVPQLLQAYYLGRYTSATVTADEEKRNIFRYAGTWTRAFPSMCEITLGNCAPVCRLLNEEVSKWCTVFGLTHKWVSNNGGGSRSAVPSCRLASF